MVESLLMYHNCATGSWIVILSEFRAQKNKNGVLRLSQLTVCLFIPGLCQKIIEKQSKTDQLKVEGLIDKLTP